MHTPPYTVEIWSEPNYCKIGLSDIVSEKIIDYNYSIFLWVR